MRTAVAAVCCLLAAASVRAGTLVLHHPYGEPVDVPGMSVRVHPAWPDRIDCSVAPVVSVAGRVITVRMRQLVTGAPAACYPYPEAPLDRLEAGWWTGVLEIYDPTGRFFRESRVSDWQVFTPGTTCNAYPFPREVTVGVVPRGAVTAAEFLNRLATDPAFAERVGHPLRALTRSSYIGLEYPLLDNPHDIRARLLATGEFSDVWVNGSVCFATPPPDRMGRVVEYFNAGLGHYFYTPDPAEQAILDEGAAIRGWVRTGLGFSVLLEPGCPDGRTEQPTYRFFGKPGVGPRSHVFTVQRDECRVVDRSGAWLFEGSQFWATPTSGNGCISPAEIPLHRLWKPVGESNHRFTTDWGMVEEMQAKGWVYEGVRMCVRR